MTVPVRKDTSIWTLVAKLATSFGGDTLQLIDNWDADLFAIGVAHSNDERRLVYVSTFGKPPGRYVCDCEESDTLGASTTIAHCEDVGFDELLVFLGRHLAFVPIRHEEIS